MQSFTVEGAGRILALVPCLARLMATAGLSAGAPQEPGQARASWSPSVALAVKEEYDDNLFAQDVTPLGGLSSFVTTLIPSVGMSYRSGKEVSVSLDYAPELAFFHSHPSEDHVLHRVGLNGAVASGAGMWELRQSLVAIDGSRIGPTYTGEGGAPAAGGPRVRDRRDATVYRGSLRVTHETSPLLVRPGVAAYVHDFGTEHRATPGYQNFVDRADVHGGVDLGTKVADGLCAWVGYRYGFQDQAGLLSYPEEYDSTYHRVLFQVEGSPVRWARVAVAIGPEFRRFGDRVPASFGDRDVRNLFIDASGTLTLGPSDTATVSVKRFQQPGFAGRSVYDDTTYELRWKHTFSERWDVVMGGRAYNTDFAYPAVRDDWIFSVSAAVSHTINSQFNAEISFTHEVGESRIPDTRARDYHRNVAAVGLRYTFR
ncbi:MAG: hypothetical protein KF833_12300 [Verrucomicrobiae bacterium]|nr:hypothetical protein [Verrucomicrobiae bacterium]